VPIMRRSKAIANFDQRHAFDDCSREQKVVLPCAFGRSLAVCATRDDSRKNVTIFCLIQGRFAPHLVYPQAGKSHILLLTVITGF
jgi:hypothetical protein